MIPFKQLLLSSSLVEALTSNKQLCLVAKSSSTLLEPHRLEPAMLFCLWDFPGKNTGVGCNFLFQGISLNQGLNPTSPALAGGLFTTEPPRKPSAAVTLSYITMRLRLRHEPHDLSGTST